MQGQQIPSQQTPGDKRASNLKTPTPSKRKTVRTWVTSSLLQSVAGRASTPSFAVSKQTPVPQKGESIGGQQKGNLVVQLKHLTDNKCLFLSCISSIPKKN
eukprot:1157465-Pelagomonas_calceolata.AAC.4